MNKKRPNKAAKADGFAAACLGRWASKTYNRG